ncbi:MAG TPA: metallophosphoesterase [Gammaproteobacteria bacterium]|nr:metallophosphoesterase [Gammaproteobacteria bacterium]
MTRVAIQLVATLCLAGALGSSRAEEPWQIRTQDRLIAVSDIHGAHDAFVTLLEQTGVIGPDASWAAGTDRLIVVGDVLDRGPASQAALGLIIALKEQARAAGGDLHFVLGNHEVMNLVGDLRYVAAEDYAAFASAESAAARATGFEHYLTRLDSESGPIDPATAQAQFDRRHPAGFFAHREAYSSTGRYGRWLLEQPLLLVAGDTAFVHAGFSRAYADVATADINGELKRELRDYVAAMETLFAAGVLSPIDEFYDHPAIVDRYAERVAAGDAVWPPGSETAAQQLKQLNEAAVFALASPIWYRGMVACSPLVERDHWARMLERLAVERIVVGHTPTPDARVLGRMNGGIVRIDTGMLASYYGGRAAALSIDGGMLAVSYAGERVAAAPAPQPRRVGGRPGRLTDDELEALLAEGVIAARTQTGERLRVTLRDGGLEITADFYPAEATELRPAVAAYRLDRLLGLDMVPVTVARDVDGMPGSLQFVPTNLMTEEERSTLGTGGAAWCPLRDQYPSMYVFDTLVYNEGRGVQQIAYETESFQLVLLGHERTFSTRRGRPPHLRDAVLEPSAAWADALRALDAERLDQALGDVLSRRQIRALARRAEEVLEAAAAP